jgi:hypothetical protein
VHAEIERRIGTSGFGYFAKPRARHHDRAAGDKAALGEIEKSTVGAVTHPDIVDVEDDGTFDPEGSGEGHDRR